MSLCEAGRCVLATETKRGECVFVWKPDDPRGGGEREKGGKASFNDFSQT